jgi:hypothetical protein
LGHYEIAGKPSVTIKRGAWPPLDCFASLAMT